MRDHDVVIGHAVHQQQRPRLGRFRGSRQQINAVLDFAADKFAEARRSPEAAEGLRAFAEKRPPKWAIE